jgi:hypothetical protein
MCALTQKEYQDPSAAAGYSEKCLISTPREMTLDRATQATYVPISYEKKGCDDAPLLAPTALRFREAEQYRMVTLRPTVKTTGGFLHLIITADEVVPYGTPEADAAAEGAWTVWTAGQPDVRDEAARAHVRGTIVRSTRLSFHKCIFRKRRPDEVRGVAGAQPARVALSLPTIDVGVVRDGVRDGRAPDAHHENSDNLPMHLDPSERIGGVRASSAGVSTTSPTTTPDPGRNPVSTTLVPSQNAELWPPVGDTSSSPASLFPDC